MKYLFIGNSHTYFNDMAHIFEEMLKGTDDNPHVTMLTKGGMGFPYHVKEEQTLFNIRYGHYDYVILQHVAHPMGDIDEMMKAGKQLIEWVKEAGAKPVLYMTWAKKGEEDYQPTMSNHYRSLAKSEKTLLAPVGEVWQKVRKAIPELELFYKDGAHASPAGSKLAAATIFSTIFDKAAPSDTDEDRIIADTALKTAEEENR